MAGIQGFEPRFSDPESDVLPLDDIPKHYSFRERGYLSIGGEKMQAPKKFFEKYILRGCENAKLAHENASSGLNLGAVDTIIATVVCPVVFSASS